MEVFQGFQQCYAANSPVPLSLDHGDLVNLHVLIHNTLAINVNCANAGGLLRAPCKLEADSMLQDNAF